LFVFDLVQNFSLAAVTVFVRYMLLGKKYIYIEKKTIKLSDDD